MSGLETLLRALPKVELHVHLEGSIRPEMAIRLAQRRGIVLPGMDRGVEGLREEFRFTSFQDFIRLYVVLSSAMVEAEDFAEVVEDVAQALARQGVRYAEMTFTPMSHIARGVAEATLFAGLAEGRVRALEGHDVQISWVFDIVRCFPDQAIPTLEMALRQRRAGNCVVALGLGGPEGPQWPACAPLREAFARAKAEALHRVPHAGEQTGSWSVREAVDCYHAQRIGHGFRSVEDPALLHELAENGISLELCPGSNVTLGMVPSLAKHPLPTIDAAGVRWSLASDDPPMFGTSLLDEYRNCATQWGWSAEKLLSVAEAAVEQSFLSEGAKQALLAEQREVFAREYLGILA
ncbi:MAG: adenosine deaminase [Nannocystaceae bacterium]